MSVSTCGSHHALKEWLSQVEKLCQPNEMKWVDGSDQEYQHLCDLLVEKGSLFKLNEKKRANSYLARSAPEDVARVESRTFICTPSREEAGPTNNWCDPLEMKETLKNLFKGSMKGKTCYIIPFCMGPLNSPIAKIGIQITDSPYVVINMRLMTRMGKTVKDKIIQEKRDFIPCWHSVGSSEKTAHLSWPCDPENIHVVHFPKEREIWSYGSGYGGNALLGKKCLALRIASCMARDEGWLAEHMLIMGVTNPEGEKKYIAAAFPSACGKTNLAMMLPSLKGWKVECVGDDIAWMFFDREGRLRAVNPEKGFFGVAPGTNYKSNSLAMEAIKENALFTNVAMSDGGDVWWEGLEDQPEHLTDWLGQEFDPDKKKNAAHPNARFTVGIEQCPSLDPKWDDPAGVLIEAIIFGGRRLKGINLVMEAFDWKYGVFYGASLSSEKTAAATGELGKLRHDPFAMLPFCGYHMADYFSHWLKMEKDNRKLPKVFYVNWFSRGDNGEFLWPGFRENSRVIKWIFERCKGQYPDSIKAPVGILPRPEDLDLSGLDISADILEKLLSLDKDHWKEEVQELRSYFKIFGTHLPEDLIHCLDQIEESLQKYESS